MKITCPSCNTSFLLNKNKLTKKIKKLKCSNCNHIWSNEIIVSDPNLDQQNQKYITVSSKENSFFYTKLLVTVLIIVMLLYTIILSKNELIELNANWLLFFEYLDELIPI